MAAGGKSGKGDVPWIVWGPEFWLPGPCQHRTECRAFKIWVRS